MVKEGNSSERTRNYATLVYPESAPQNWKTILSELCVPCFISPLHDRDLHEDGTPKKPHYHVMFMFDGVKSGMQVRKMVDTFGGVGVEVINSSRGYARYLCHLDDEDKARYDTKDVKMLGGADYFSVISLPTDKYMAISEMIDYCNKNRVYSYASLLEYSRLEHFDWFKVLCDSGTTVIKEYLKSLTWSMQK